MSVGPPLPQTSDRLFSTHCVNTQSSGTIILQCELHVRSLPMVDPRQKATTIVFPIAANG